MQIRAYVAIDPHPGVESLKGAKKAASDLRGSIVDENAVHSEFPARQGRYYHNQ